MLIWRQTLAALLLLGAASAAQAIDYRSVNVPAAILYDSPSQQGKKLYLIKAQTPVEVVVRLGGWLKVRDAEGALAWIEAGDLADRRTLVVTAPRAAIRQACLERPHRQHSDEGYRSVPGRRRSTVPRQR